MQFIDKIILKIKENPNRFNPLTLIFNLDVKIETPVRFINILEKDYEVKQKLFLQFKMVKDYDKNDFQKVLPFIEKEQNPILHKYISMEAGHLE